MNTTMKFASNTFKPIVLQWGFVALLFIFVFSNVQAQTHTSDNDGFWMDGANWVGNTPPALINPGGITTNSAHWIEINSIIELMSGLNVNGGTQLVITTGSVLIINGNVTFFNNSSVYIEPGALLIINGNVTNNNNSDNIIVDGTIQINGNFVGGNGSTLDGAGNMDITGSVTTDGSGNVFGSTVNCTEDCSSSGMNPLPIELGDFSVIHENGQNIVLWTTLTERDNAYFSLHHSTDGLEWNLLANINGAGNSSFTISYSYNHILINEGQHYYKLSQTDFDGSTKSFDPISIHVGSKSKKSKLYNLAGQQVDENFEGFVIEQFSDGTTIKRIK